MKEKTNLKINKKQSTLMITLGITMLLMAIVGVTYAYFVVNLDFTPGSSINVEVGSFGDVAFVDGNQINLPGGYPGDILTKTFTVTRTNATDTTSINYKIMLYVRENTLTPVSNGYFTYTLSGVKTGKGTLVTASNVVVPTSTSQIGSNGEFTGNGVHTYTFSIGLKESNGDQRSTMAKNFKGYLQVESIDTTYILTNLVKNGSFDTDLSEWTTGGTRYATGGINNSGYMRVTPNRAYHAVYSNSFTIPYQHKIYTRAYYRKTGGGGTRTLIYDYTKAYGFASILPSTDTSVWTSVSQVGTNTHEDMYTYSYLLYGAGTVYVAGMYTEWDNAMVIDLTATFGEGNEPPQEWCDANIPFFEGSKGFDFYTHKDLILHYDAIDNTLDGHSNSTTTWYDLSGNGKNGTLTNFGSTLTSGWQKDSLAFDGTNDWVSIGQLNQNTYTIELVAEPTVIGNGESILVGNYDGGGYGLTFQNGIIKNSAYISGYKYSYSSDTLIANTKYNYVGTYDGNTLKIYTNGILKNSSSFSGPIGVPGSTVMALGANPSGTNATGGYFQGNMYSVRIYSRALTDTEIQYNYSVDRNRFGLN